MSQNQLTDEGSVIGYQPKLEYIKNRENTIENEKNSQNSDENTNISDILDNLSNNSLSLQSFYKYMPSNTLNTLNTVSKELKTLVDALSNAFSEGKWNQYSNIESLISAMDYENDEYIEKFVNYHKYNITGSIIPELISSIYDTNKRLNLISKTLQRLYYNTHNLTQEEMHEKDIEYTKRIARYENEDEYYKINYIAISCDALLNKSISHYAYSVNAACTDLSYIININTNDIANGGKVETVKNLYSKVNNEIDYRNSAYKKYQTLAILEKTLYNYYYKRQELFDLYDLLTDGNSMFIVNEIIENQKILESAIQNCNRTYVGNVSHIKELKKLEEKKYYLLNIYDQLSTIS